MPITAQSLGVHDGRRRASAPDAATIAVLIVLVLVAIGLPVLSGGRGGLAAFAAPTTGFLVGWVFAALTTGFLQRAAGEAGTAGNPATGRLFMAAVIGGIVVLYAFGIAYLAVCRPDRPQAGLRRVRWPLSPATSSRRFVAALVGRAVMAGYPVARGRS